MVRFPDVEARASAENDAGSGTQALQQPGRRRTGAKPAFSVVDDPAGPAGPSEATFFCAFGPEVEEADAFLQRAHEAAEKSYHAPDAELSVTLLQLERKLYPGSSLCTSRGAPRNF